MNISNDSWGQVVNIRVPWIKLNYGYCAVYMYCMLSWDNQVYLRFRLRLTVWGAVPFRAGHAPGRGVTKREPHNPWPILIWYSDYICRCDGYSTSDWNCRYPVAEGESIFTATSVLPKKPW